MLEQMLFALLNPALNDKKNDDLCNSYRSCNLFDLKHDSFRNRAFSSNIPDAKKTVSYLTQTCMMDLVFVV